MCKSPPFTYLQLVDSVSTQECFYPFNMNIVNTVVVYYIYINVLALMGSLSFPFFHSSLPYHCLVYKLNVRKHIHN